MMSGLGNWWAWRPSAEACYLDTIEDLQKLLKRRPFVDCVEATTFRELKHEIIIKYDRVSLIAPAF